MLLFRSHCVKNVQIRSYFWSVFSCLRTEYGDLRSKSTYSVGIPENTDQEKLCIWAHAVSPYAVNVKANVGKIFMKMVDKHFPCHHKYHELFS